MTSKQQLKDRISEVMEKSKNLPERIIYRDNNFSLEKLQEEAKKELKIDIEKLTLQQAQNAVMHQRYMRILEDFIKQLNFYNRIYSELKPLKFEWYKYHYDFTIENKTEVEMYIKGDGDILNIQARIDKCNEIIRYLNDTCDDFKNRGFSFKNIIEWEKFTHGAD